MAGLYLADARVFGLLFPLFLDYDIKIFVTVVTLRENGDN